MVEITKENFNYSSSDGVASEKNSQVNFRRKYPNLWLMVRPDRPRDQTAHRYANYNERSRGNRAMKAWFEYLAAKDFTSAFKAWLSLLKSGRSIMVVCDDPCVFDIEFSYPKEPILPPDFWDEFERSRLPTEHRHEDPIMRERCLASIKKCMAELRMHGAHSSPAVAIRPLREWKSIPLAELDAAKPAPPISDELRRKIINVP